MRKIMVRAYWNGRYFFFEIGQLWDTHMQAIYTDLCINGSRWDEFTGQYDMNKREIYSGDIFNDGGIVVWRAIGWFVEKILSDGGKGWLRLDDYLNNDETRHVVSTVHE